MTTPILTPIHVQEEEELITCIKQLGTLEAEYPPELLAITRATIIARVEQEKRMEFHSRLIPG